jgi:hypothetical protein
MRLSEPTQLRTDPLGEHGGRPVTIQPGDYWIGQQQGDRVPIYSFEHGERVLRGWLPHDQIPPSEPIVIDEGGILPKKLWWQFWK